MLLDEGVCMSLGSEMESIARRAKAAAGQLASVSTPQKDKALLSMADLLDKRREYILRSNAVDLENA